MPRNSQAEKPSLLIAAISARSLAQSARRAGFTPLVADFFADADTQEAAHACRKLRGIERGMQWRSLCRALDALADRAPSPIAGFVYGAGFEDRPELLKPRTRAKLPLPTNSAETARPSTRCWK